MGSRKGTVCVTGGTGYLATWTIKRLLEQGYSVRATVRPDPDGKRDISFLTNLAKALQSLQIFHADLGDPESFAPAIKGCVGVFHMAATIDFHGQELMERAICEGVGILRACSSAETVRQVVYTSSSTAMHGERHRRKDHGRGLMDRRGDGQGIEDDRRARHGLQDVGRECGSQFRGGRWGWMWWWWFLPS